MSEFLYCHDPLDEEVGEFLLHLGNPGALIKIIPLEDEEAIESEEFIHKIFIYENEDGDSESYQLIFTPLATAMESPASPSTERIQNVLEAAWEYWIEVLNWEEDEEDEE